MPEPWGVEGVINPVQRRADGHAGPTQPHFYVRQALAVSDLSKRHGKELILTREVMNPVVAVVAVGTSAKLFAMNPVHDLTENRFFGAHSSSLALPVLQTNSKLSRNRHTAFIAQAAHIPTFSVNATSPKRMTVFSLVKMPRNFVTPSHRIQRRIFKDKTI
jgi:hypothetical protein